MWAADLNDLAIFAKSVNSFSILENVELHVPGYVSRIFLGQVSCLLALMCRITSTRSDPAQRFVGAAAGAADAFFSIGVALPPCLACQNLCISFKYSILSVF